MIPDEVIKGDIKEYCIACLSKNLEMHNLNQHIEKKSLFTTIFNIELDTYREYPQFLCYVCDIKLSVTTNFQENVNKSLAILKEYNEKITQAASQQREIKQETAEDETRDRLDNVETVESEDEHVTKLKASTYRRIASKIDLVSPEKVNSVIEEFKNRLSESKTCVLCGFIAANRRAISSHMAIFHKDIKTSYCLECNDIVENYEDHKLTHSSKYSCPFCAKEVNLPHYIEHLQSHSGTFECDVCNKVFKSAGWLKKHKCIHTNDKPYICPNCSKRFIQLSSLRYHVGTHGKFACDFCKKHYKTNNDLTEHKCVASENADDGNQNESDVDETIIIKGRIGCVDLQNFCKECNKRVKSLSQHIQKHHEVPEQALEAPTIKKLHCTLCQKAFNNAYKLKVHLRTHTGERPYKCRYCDKRTMNRSRLKDHERTHTKEKPYICNVCGKALSQASALRTHMRQHTGRPEVCELCNKRFCRKSELKLHLSKHMGEKPFLCTECGKTFAQKSHLTEHMAGHGEERPFQCQYCEKAFKKNILLKEHLKIHNGYKSFKCPSCSYACYKAYRLQQHMKQHRNLEDQLKNEVHE